MPTADVSMCSRLVVQRLGLLDQLVCAREQRRRIVNPRALATLTLMTSSKVAEEDVARRWPPWGHGRILGGSVNR